MINKVLINLAYFFYPQKVCAITEQNKYFASKEYKGLVELINDFDIHKKKYLNIEKIFEKDPVLKDIRDISLPNYVDRSLGFCLTVIENDELYTVVLYLSVLIPFYTITIQKNKIELFFSESEIVKMRNKKTDTRNLKELISDISSVIEATTLYKKFPQELMSVIIEDISFQEIPFGQFNMFNAFFKN